MINRPPVRHPWGGGSHFATSLHDHMIDMGHEVVCQLEENIDVILMIDPRPDKGGDDVNFIYQYKHNNPNCKVIHRINDTDIARGTNFLDDIIIKSNKVTADYTIFISEWVKKYYYSKGLKNNSDKQKVIVNGCNTNWYYPKKEKKLGDKIRLLTHHWSDNYMKGFDVYNFLDQFCKEKENIEFTYLGRYNKQYQPAHTSIISPKYGPEVGEIIRSHDIYVTAARWEACGSHHIEGSACGLPVLYHKDGGAIPEICNSHGLEFEDPQSFENSLNEIILNYDKFIEKIDYQKLSIERCLKEYYDVILGIIDA